MIIDIENWPGQPNVSKLIGGSENSGWHGLIGVPPSILKWYRNSDVSELPLQWTDYPLNTEDAEHAILGDVLVVGGRRQNNTGPSRIRFGDFDPATGLPIPGSEYENGDGQSRWGGSCKTNNGGFVAAFWVDVQPKTTIVLDIFYRKPLMPIEEPSIFFGFGEDTEPAPSKWWYERRSFSTTTQSGLYSFAQVVQGTDGLIYIFVVRDSAGTVALLRYKPTVSGLVFVDEDPDFIPRSNPTDPEEVQLLGPSGESPRITAVTDRYNGRILLCYCSFLYIESPCLEQQTANRFAGHWSVVEVLPNKKTKLLGATPWWTSHAGHTIPVIVPRRDGVYFLLDHVDPATCAYGWHNGILIDGQFNIDLSLPKGSILGKSDDGWCFWLNRTTQPFPTTFLMRVLCRPEMTISRQGNSIVINWEPFTPGDELQERVEGADIETQPTWEWQTPFVCVPPAVFPLESSSKMFRVVQSSPMGS